jgi:hypothetical protein
VAVAASAGGYHLAFLVGAVFAAAAAGVGAVLLRQRPDVEEEAEIGAEPEAEPKAKAA